MGELNFADYRRRLEGVATVEVGLVREILDAAERELEQAHGEFTLAQAVYMSGRSRRWFERRLPALTEQGLARKPGRVWLLKRAAIPARQEAGAFDETLSADEIADRLLAS